MNALYLIKVKIFKAGERYQVCIFGNLDLPLIPQTGKAQRVGNTSLTYVASVCVSEGLTKVGHCKCSEEFSSHSSSSFCSLC